MSRTSRQAFQRSFCSRGARDRDHRGDRQVRTAESLANFLCKSVVFEWIGLSMSRIQFDT